MFVAMRRSAILGSCVRRGVAIRSYSAKKPVGNVTNAYVKRDGEAPSKLASESQLPYIEDPERVSRDIDPKSKVQVIKEEKNSYVLPKWKESIGEAVISVFNVDMDKVRAGSVGGSKYYYDCKNQGLQFAKEELSETAKFYYETLQLPRSFSQWFQITSLHIWLLFVRMRAMPFKYGKDYQQKLVDRFFKDIEMRLSEEMNVQSGRIIDTYLKDFNDQLKGVILSYDEGLITDDATLAAAVWRNLFNGERNVDLVHVEAMVRYIRMQLYVLDKISDREFGFGRFEFVKPDEVVEVLSDSQLNTIKERVRAEFEPHGKILPSLRSNLSLDE